MLQIRKSPFLDLHLPVSNGFVSSKIYDKRDDYDFDLINFPVLGGDVPRRPSYGVNISQLIRFARVCSHLTDFLISFEKIIRRKRTGYDFNVMRQSALLLINTIMVDNFDALFNCTPVDRAS